MNILKHWTSASILTTLLFATTPAGAQNNKNNQAALQKLSMAEMAITSLYVDSVDNNKLVEDAIRGMLSKLDPHSTYATAKESKAQTESLQGSFEGIGVQFNIVEDTLLVIQPVLGGPSEKVGILAGDRIISVNDTAIAGVKMSREDIMRRLRGPKGTKVNLGIVRRGIQDKLLFTVKRDKIPVHTLEASYMIRPGIGYIRIGSFGATTHEEFLNALDTLQMKNEGQQLSNLILDLQDNGGGYLQAAVELANEFLSPGDLIVYTESRSLPRQEFRVRRNGRLRNGVRVTVLINEYTASAAEIVTGALQDHDRAEVVGRRSFGKGLVQRPIEFPDGSMIRLTVSHYFTPSGRCIQKPYVKGESKAYSEDIERRFKHGELYSADSIHFADSLKYETLLLHRTVYGGGGIMPDVFVPLDTTQFTSFHRQLAAKGIIINTNLKYVDSHRKELQRQYKSFEDFLSRYVVPQNLLDDIVAKAEKEKVKPRDEAELQRSLPSISLQMKALIARDLWGMNEYFTVINESNHTVQQALQLFESPRPW